MIRKNGSRGSAKIRLQTIAWSGMIRRKIVALQARKTGRHAKQASRQNRKQRRKPMLNRTHITALIGAAALAGLTCAARADDIYIPLISKGFQHQFWQAVKLGAEQEAQKDKVKISFEGPETEAMVDKQIDMLSADLA